MNNGSIIQTVWYFLLHGSHAHAIKEILAFNLLTLVHPFFILSSLLTLHLDLKHPSPLLAFFVSHSAVADTYFIPNPTKYLNTFCMFSITFVLAPYQYLACLNHSLWYFHFHFLFFLGIISPILNWQCKFCDNFCLSAKMQKLCSASSGLSEFCVHWWYLKYMPTFANLQLINFQLDKENTVT